jgi:hypothetical protein
MTDGANDASGGADGVVLEGVSAGPQAYGAGSAVAVSVRVFGEDRVVVGESGSALETPLGSLLLTRHG